MGDRAEQMLRQWGVPPNYVGYAYLLDAADLFRQGVAPSPQLFETIAQRHGKRGFQVRKGMANVAKYLRTTAMGQAWRREQGRLLSHWDVIFLLWGAVGKGQPWPFPPFLPKGSPDWAAFSVCNREGAGHVPAGGLTCSAGECPQSPGG